MSTHGCKTHTATFELKKIWSYFQTSYKQTAFDAGLLVKGAHVPRVIMVTSLIGRFQGKSTAAAVTAQGPVSMS